jgi:glycosyltransferase involved in cell wall biosynthesis
MKQQASQLLVFADDWGRHPSSCQHLVSHLLSRHEVWWVNTIGTRRPRFDAATLRRCMEKLRHWSSPARSHVQKGCRQPAPPNLHLLDPRMWPSFGSWLERRINRKLLMSQLIPCLASLPEPPVAVTTIPIVADLVGLLPVRRWVYYCVDDFAEWPGLDGRTLSVMEKRLIQRADVLVAVSSNLQQNIERQGRSAHLLTHGVDLGDWDQGHSPASLSCPCVLDGLEHPLIVFWGLVDRRIDSAFLERLSNDLTTGTIVLVGPESDPDPALVRLPRLVRLPSVPFEQLPAIARAARVLIMPYADLPVTQAMQPLKLKEYLATGKPVVVSDLPSTRLWADALDVATNPQMFSRRVRERVGSGLPGSQHEARLRLGHESWSAKARVFETWLLGDEANTPREEQGSRLIDVCS